MPAKTKPSSKKKPVAKKPAPKAVKKPAPAKKQTKPAKAAVKSKVKPVSKKSAKAPAPKKKSAPVKAAPAKKKSVPAKAVQAQKKPAPAKAAPAKKKIATAKPAPAKTKQPKAKAPAPKAPVKKSPVKSTAKASKPAPAKAKTPAKKAAPAKAEKPAPAKKEAPTKKAAPAKVEAPTPAPAPSAHVTPAAKAKKSDTKKSSTKTPPVISGGPLSKMPRRMVIEEPEITIERSKGPVKMTPFLKRQKQKLIELRDTLLNTIDGVASESLNSDGGSSSAFGMHQADAGSDAYDRDFALSLLGKEQDALYEINEALKRIDDGTYGICEMSGKRIPEERLDALPFTRYTVESQSRIERDQFGGRYGARPQRSLFGLDDASEEGEDSSDDEESESLDFKQE